MSTRKHAADSKEVVAAQTESKLAEPAQYMVFLLNDDYTPMDFVVDVLMKFFDMNEPEATMIMLQVHKKGKGNCGVFTRDIAESKVNLVNSYSRFNSQPLLCRMERI